MDLLLNDVEIPEGTIEITEDTFHNHREMIGKQVNELHHMLDKNRIPYEYSFVKNGREVIEMKVNV